MLRFFENAGLRARSQSADKSESQAGYRRGSTLDSVGLDALEDELLDSKSHSRLCYLAQDEYPKVVHLNVGGKKYMTSLETLRSRPDSMLADMFYGDLPVCRDNAGTFFIDRDGDCFHHILNNLRDGSVPIGLTQMQRLHLLRETKFLRLDVLHAILGGVQAPHYHSQESLSWKARRNAQQTQIRSAMYGIQSTQSQMALMENFDFVPSQRQVRMYARLRYGHEYPGDWIVSSPRNLRGVEYELYEATLGRDLIPAMNKMMNAGFSPCVIPPVIPKLADYHTDVWHLMMYRDVPLRSNSLGEEVLDHPLGSAVGSASCNSQSWSAVGSTAEFHDRQNARGVLSPTDMPSSPMSIAHESPLELPTHMHL